MTGMLDDYHARIVRGDLKSDPHQEAAAKALQTVLEGLSIKRGFFNRAPWPKGVYIHGGVGRGKSMLMDLFFSHVPQTLSKRRVHFHAFMIETHDWLHQKRSGGAVDNLLPLYAKHVAAHTRVLCFDEFHVTDVADAMILSRLFTALFDLGVVVIATSNWVPDRLYEGGLQRDRFLPFIALLKDRMTIVHLDSPTDYRVETVQDLQTYLYPLNAHTHEKMDMYFAALSAHAPVQSVTLRIKGRDIAVQTAGGVARFTFAQLCEQPHGAEDYLAIAAQFHTVFLENIPRLTYDRRNETKRLMTLIDVLYDSRRRVILSAEAPPEKLYSGHDHAFEFDRTISRLQEMQSSSYTSLVGV